jgi:hypothetical protein
MIPEEQNKALDAWQTSTRYWDKYRILIAQMFATAKNRRIYTCGITEAVALRRFV